VGQALVLASDYPAAVSAARQALDTFCDLGDRIGREWALETLGYAQVYTGDYPAATASLLQGLQLSREIGSAGRSATGRKRALSWKAWAMCSG
jgi:hypothetical protein